MNKEEKRRQRILKIAANGGTDKDLELLDAIYELEDKFDTTVEEIQESAPDLDKILATVKGNDGLNGKDGEGSVGPKGDKGESVVGPSGKDGKDGKNGRDGRDGRDGIDGRDGLDGKDAELNLEEEVVTLINYLETLEGEDRLDAKAIKNLPEFTREIVRESGYNQFVETPIKAGNNITVTRDAFGAWVITSTALGGGTGYTKATPTGAINGVNIVYGVVAIPVYVIADGTTFFDGAGYTYSALTITMDNPVTQYIRYFY